LHRVAVHAHCPGGTGAATRCDGAVQRGPSIPIERVDASIPKISDGAVRAFAVMRMPARRGGGTPSSSDPMLVNSVTNRARGAIGASRAVLR
jgi:hypothetical protein